MKLRQSIQPVSFDGGFGGELEILGVEGPTEFIGEICRNGFRIGNPDSSQILRLEAEVAAPHADVVAMDEELADCGNQEAA